MNREYCEHLETDSEFMREERRLEKIERRWACLSFTVIANVANYVIAQHIPQWSSYCYGIATAATGASYLYQLLAASMSLLVRWRQTSKCYKPR